MRQKVYILQQNHVDFNSVFSFKNDGSTTKPEESRLLYSQIAEQWK